MLPWEFKVISKITTFCWAPVKLSENFGGYREIQCIEMVGLAPSWCFSVTWHEIHHWQVWRNKLQNNLWDPCLSSSKLPPLRVALHVIGHACQAWQVIDYWPCGFLQFVFHVTFIVQSHELSKSNQNSALSCESSRINQSKPSQGSSDIIDWQSAFLQALK